MSNAGSGGWRALVVTGLVVLGGPVWPGAVEAQGARTPPRIGMLRSVTGWGVFLTPWLTELGYQEGRDFAVEPALVDRDERLPAAAAELVRGKVDVIVAAGRSAAFAAKAATATIPIVMVMAGDPVRAGLVRSLGRPGGNVTGMTTLSHEIAGKRLQFLTETVPGIGRVGVLWNPEDTENLEEWQETQGAARALGVQIESLEARAPADFEPAIQRGVRTRMGGLIVLESRLTVSRAAMVAEVAARLRLPAVYPSRYFVQPPQNGLLSYGPSSIEIQRRLAHHVDRILKGARPSDLPVEQPTEFDLVVNLRAASALGVSLPKSLLQRADRVFE